jgi:hypothetical protein
MHHIHVRPHYCMRARDHYLHWTLLVCIMLRPLKVQRDLRRPKQADFMAPSVNYICSTFHATSIKYQYNTMHFCVYILLIDHTYGKLINILDGISGDDLSFVNKKQK